MKVHDAKSLAPARQDRRVATARCGVRLVFDESQRNICIRSARLGGRLPAQDRRARSSAASQEEMTSWELAETSLQEQGGKSYDTRAGQFRWLRSQSHGGPVLDDGRRQGNTMRCQCL